jgi:isoaspartyl peptidase/L-asparaginase-like protein (Ntn-hydrolase superfamily)
MRLFMVIARKIWMRRNHVVFDGEFNPPKAPIAEMTLLEFRKSNLVTNETRASSSSIEEDKWMPPPRNTVKINWDAAVAIEKKDIGIGFIAWDEKGKFLGAVSKKE